MGAMCSGKTENPVAIDKRGNDPNAMPKVQYTPVDFNCTNPYDFVDEEYLKWAEKDQVEKDKLAK